MITTKIILRKYVLLFSLILLAVNGIAHPGNRQQFFKQFLSEEHFRHYAEYFNRMEKPGLYGAIPDSLAWKWMTENIPFFECPQDNFEEIYYFRWWSFRKHLIQTPKGWGITEFLVKRSYADRYNLISCALGHHIMESRWLYHKDYIRDDVLLWYRGNDGNPMRKLMNFSSWTSYALYQYYLVSKDKNFICSLWPDLTAEFRRWEKTHQVADGLYWQYDVHDGMEDQISGARHKKNKRPTINSYSYGNATALSRIAELCQYSDSACFFSQKADNLKKMINSRLWNPVDSFYETVTEGDQFSNVREEIGFIPWYFNIPDSSKTVAWKQLMDPKGFWAPYGITTAEQRHPEFRTHGCCNCEWDGAVWPFATSQTMTAMANLLNDYSGFPVSKEDYFQLLNLYVESQYHRGHPYIGEYLDPVTGYWLKGDQERSRFYNHSTFADLIITGLVGLRPRSDSTLVLNPLIPKEKWDWFCLDHIYYHSHWLTIVWDKYGKKYSHGKGFYILVDGKKVAHRKNLGLLTAILK